MYYAMCSIDSLSLLEQALGLQANDDIVSSVLAFVSWFHLCWVCNELRSHHTGAVYLMCHASYMVGYASGVTNNCFCNNTFNHLDVQFNPSQLATTNNYSEYFSPKNIEGTDNLQDSVPFSLYSTTPSTQTLGDGIKNLTPSQRNVSKFLKKQYYRNKR